MKPFIDLAIRGGVKHVVFLSASGMEAGGLGTGKVQFGTDFFIVRPFVMFRISRSLLSPSYLFLFSRRIQSRRAITYKGTIVTASGDDIAVLTLRSQHSWGFFFVILVMFCKGLPLFKLSIVGDTSHNFYDSRRHRIHEPYLALALVYGGFSIYRPLDKR